MRIVHYVPAFSVLTETFIYDTLLGLRQSDTENYVVTHERLHEHDRPFEGVHVVPLPEGWHMAAQVRRAQRALFRSTGIIAGSLTGNGRGMARLVERLRPDILHAHFGSAAVNIAPAAKRLRIPLVASFYGLDASRLPRRLQWRLAYKHLFAQARTLIVPSVDLADRLQQLGAPADRLHVVRLATRLGDHAYREPRGPPRNWISVGRMTHKKGFFDLIDAFTLIGRETPLTLTLVGDGELLDAIRQHAATRSGMAGQIRILPGLPHHQVIAAMRSADAFVLASHTAPDGDREGTPVALLEAQALGLPCVSTWHAGIPEMIPPENHRFLAAEHDPAQLAERIQALSALSTERLVEVTKRARRLVEDEFGLPRQTHALIALYTAARIVADAASPAGRHPDRD